MTKQEIKTICALIDGVTLTKSSYYGDSVYIDQVGIEKFKRTITSIFSDDDGNDNNNTKESNPKC